MKGKSERLIVEEKGKGWREGTPPAEGMSSFNTFASKKLLIISFTS